MGDGYRKIIQDHDDVACAARQRDAAEAERRTADAIRAQAAVDHWFSSVFRSELDSANAAMRDLEASLLVTDTQKVGGKARHRLEFRRHGRMSPPYMLIIGDGEFSVVQYTSTRSPCGVSGPPPEVNEQSEVAPYRRLGMGADDECVPRIIETMIAESLRMLPC